MKEAGDDLLDWPLNSIIGQTTDIDKAREWAKGDIDNNFAVTIAHAQELEEFIEERRQKALLQIAKMRGEPGTDD